MPQLRVVAVLVAPVDVVEDEPGLGLVVGMVSAGEAEVAQALELWLDPVEPGGVVGRVGELDIVVDRPLAHLFALVDGEVVEHEGEPQRAGIASADRPAGGEELRPSLALLEVADKQVATDVERAEQVPDAVRAGVGGADPARLRARRPRLAARLRLQVERPELVQADDDAGVVRPGFASPSAIAYSSRIRFFFASKAGSFERFHVLKA